MSRPTDSCRGFEPISRLHSSTFLKLPLLFLCPGIGVLLAVLIDPPRTTPVPGVPVLVASSSSIASSCRSGLPSSAAGSLGNETRAATEPDNSVAADDKDDGDTRPLTPL